MSFISRRYDPTIDFDPILPPDPKPSARASAGTHNGNGHPPLRLTPGHRRPYLLRKAGVLQRSNLTPAAIAACLHAENAQRCEPPLTVTELDALITDITARWTPDLYTVLVDNVAAKPATETADDAPHADVIEWTATELLTKTRELPPLQMRIDGLLPNEGMTLFHAQPRSLKTWLALECGLALTTKTPALGLLPVREEVPVLYVSNEDAWHNGGRRLDQLLHGRDRSSIPSPFGFAIHRGVWLDDDAWQCWLIRRVKAVGYRVVILDPLRSLSGCVDQGPRELQPLTRFLRRLMEETGVLPLLSHHDTKPLAGGQTDTRHRPQRASGGGVFSIADAPIHCERLGDDDPAMSLVVPSFWKMCETPSALKVRLTVTADTHAAQLVASPLAARDVATVATDTKILAALATVAEMSTRTLASAARIDRNHVPERCAALVTAGLVDSRPGPHNATLWFLTAKGQEHSRD